MGLGRLAPSMRGVSAARTHLGVVEAQQQVDDSGLARARGAHQGYGLALGDGQIVALAHRQIRARWVGEVYVL